MISAAQLCIVRTGTANLASVVAAFERLGVSPVLTGDAEQIASAPALVLPGVGSFAAAMDAIDKAGLRAILHDRLKSRRPTFAICLGLQVLFESSEESPGVRGLGVLPGTITRFPSTVRIPQLGWNSVTCDAECRVLAGGDAYYANSYRATRRPEGFSAAWTEHGDRFIAAIEQDAVVACQFHPELSGAWGSSILARWLDRAGIARSSPAANDQKERAAC